MVRGDWNSGEYDACFRGSVGAWSFNAFFPFHLPVPDSIREGIDRYSRVGPRHFFVVASLPFRLSASCSSPLPSCFVTPFPFPPLIDHIHCRAGRSQCVFLFFVGGLSLDMYGLCLGLSYTQPMKKVYRDMQLTLIVGVFVLVLSLSTEPLHTPTIKFGIDFSINMFFPGIN
jgi:hypothetical protein